MEEKQMGGWYNNPDQGGQNMRYWGGNTWTTGADPTGGGGVNWQQNNPKPTPGISGANVQSGGRQSSQDMFSNLSEQYGLGDLKSTAKSLSEQIYEIEDYLKTVEGDVQERSGDFLMSDAQQRRLTASESEPSRKSLADLSTAYGRTTSNIASITSDINQQMSYAIADQQYQDSVRSAAANVGIAVTGNESTEQLLTAIAGKVNENDLWEKAFKEKQLSKQGGPTSSQTAAADSLARLRADVAAGVPYYDLGPRYSSELPLSQIRQEYNAGPLAASQGKATESAQDEAKWFTKQDEDDGIVFELEDGTRITI